MPDSFPPPSWGPAPFDERDLDAVLSGEMADIPVVLRPVVDTLAALRAAPAPAELSGEATIMAEFRALAEFRVLGLGEAAPHAGPAQTLQLPALPSDRPRRRLARHRGRRQAARPVSRRPGVLMGIAAAAAIVVAVVFTGTLPGPIQRLAHLAHLSTATSSAARPTMGNSASPKVEVTSAAREPTAPASVTHSAAPGQSEASRLCHAYYGYFRHIERRSSWSGVVSLWEQLRKLTGSGNAYRMYRYCAPYVGDLFPQWSAGMGEYWPGTHTGPGSPGFSLPAQQNGSGYSQQSGPGANSSQLFRQRIHDRGAGPLERGALIVVQPVEDEAADGRDMPGGG